jgi:hypothetical protein
MALIKRKKVQAGEPFDIRKIKKRFSKLNTGDAFDQVEVVAGEVQRALERYRREGSDDMLAELKMAQQVLDVGIEEIEERHR